MTNRRCPRILLVLAGLTTLSGACGPGPRQPTVAEPVPGAVEPALPTLRVEQMAGGEAVRDPAGEREPEAGEEPGLVGRPWTGERVTLTASGTDLRVVLAALAEAAGVSLVVGPEVQGRVTVHFEDVPAGEALERLILETGHMVTEPLRSPWGPTVFHVVPVNVNAADAETIRARFGVSPELARFLVRARIPAN